VQRQGSAAPRFGHGKPAGGASLGRSAGFAALVEDSENVSPRKRWLSSSTKRYEKDGKYIVRVLYSRYHFIGGHGGAGALLPWGRCTVCRLCLRLPLYLALVRCVPFPPGLVRGSPVMCAGEGPGRGWDQGHPGLGPLGSCCV